MKDETWKRKKITEISSLPSSWTYFNIDPRHILPAAAEAPADQPGELVVAGVLADQGTASVTLRVERSHEMDGKV